MRTVLPALALLSLAIAPATAWPSVPVELGGTWTVRSGGAEVADTPLDGATRTMAATLRIEAFNPVLGPIWQVRTPEANYHCHNGIPLYQPMVAGAGPVRHPWAGGTCALADSGAPWAPSWDTDLVQAGGQAVHAFRGSGTFG